MISPMILLSFDRTTRRIAGGTLATLAIIVMLPLFVVGAMGTSTLTVLAAAVSLNVVGFYEGPLSPNNSYAWGNCTYWASLRRESMGKPIPNTWGNANTWALYARLGGWQVDRTPQVGAIMQTDRGNLGHVAFVKAVDPSNGAWTISEMNVKGLNIVNEATYPASAATNYYFIHDKVQLLP